MAHRINTEIAINISNYSRKYNKRIVFTHGAFDLFHAGHSKFLNKSKKQNEILIVGLEPESNIRKYKGLIRPIIPDSQRMEILLNHKALDFVFFVEKQDRMAQAYYTNLYKNMKPNKVTFGKKAHAKEKRKNLKIRGVELKEISAEVTSTTKIITGILNAHLNAPKA